MRYDIVVVGAGPAGSTAARECASMGLSVLMLDRAEFPRDKPCGGGVTVRAARLLPFDLGPVVERTITDMHLSLRHDRGFTQHASEDLVYLTQRCNFDTFLAERAIDQGAVLRQRTAVKEVERHPTHVVVRTPRESFEGSVLIAADGANGQTARMSGIQVALDYGIALEGNITPAGGFPSQWKHALGMEFGAVPGGYGWIFPKGDHLNIGIGGWKYIGPMLRTRLDRLVRDYGYDPKDMWGLRGYHLPIRKPGSPLVDGNVVLVGDAGGLLDPFTGEGIFAAVWSGKAAAAHCADYVGGEAEDLSGYQQEVESELGAELRVSRQFHDLFHLAPALVLAVDRRTSWLWGMAQRILRGQDTYATVMARHPVIATFVDFLSDLVRVNPFLQRLSGLHDPAPPHRFFRRASRPAEHVSVPEPSPVERHPVA